MKFVMKVHLMNSGGLNQALMDCGMKTNFKQHIVYVKVIVRCIYMYSSCDTKTMNI